MRWPRCGRIGHRLLSRARLSTNHDADTILVMEGGRIVEQGTHSSLLAADGAYSRLYNARFAGSVTDSGSST